MNAITVILIISGKINRKIEKLKICYNGFKNTYELLFNILNILSIFELECENQLHV